MTESFQFFPSLVFQPDLSVYARQEVMDAFISRVLGCGELKLLDGLLVFVGQAERPAQLLSRRSVIRIGGDRSRQV